MHIGVRLVGTRVLGHSDAVKRLEAYPAEDVEMDLAGTAIPDDESHEEPQTEETKVSEEVPNAV